MNNEAEAHRVMVSELKKSPRDIANSLTVPDIDRLHMAMGIAGEAGEVADLIKKVVFNGKQVAPAEVLAECGDVLFYMVGLLMSYGWTIEDALDNNIAKLRTRYPYGYSDAASKERADV